MAELTTLARPYAKAAFEYAREAKQLDKWSAALAIAAAVATDSAVAKLLDSPALTARQKADRLIALCEEQFDEKFRAFVTVLAENGRLDLTAMIAELFEDLKAQQEKFSDVAVTSAFALDGKVEKALASKLKTILASDIHLKTAVDSALLGGVIIRFGDTIIDGSIRGRLNRLAESFDLQ